MLPVGPGVVDMLDLVIGRSKSVVAFTLVVLPI